MLKTLLMLIMSIFFGGCPRPPRNIDIIDIINITSVLRTFFLFEDAF